MDIRTFLARHGLGSNPFLAEEARQDDVLARLESSADGEFRHPDFGKIMGDLRHPASAVRAPTGRNATPRAK